MATEPFDKVQYSKLRWIVGYNLVIPDAIEFVKNARIMRFLDYRSKVSLAKEH